MKALIDQLVAQIAQIQAGYAADIQAASDAGFKAGVASISPVVSDKIYSQADLDAAILAVKTTELASLKTEEVNLEKILA